MNIHLSLLAYVGKTVGSKAEGPEDQGRGSRVTICPWSGPRDRLASFSPPGTSAGGHPARRVYNQVVVLARTGLEVRPKA